MNRSFKAVIIISLLLNILLAAIITGHMGQSLLGSHHDHDIQEMALSLPENKRGIFMETMNHAKNDNGELREQMSDARKKAANILKANPFDRQAYIAQLQKIGDLRERTTLRTGEAIADLAAQLTPEERAILADSILSHHGTP